MTMNHDVTTSLHIRSQKGDPNNGVSHKSDVRKEENVKLFVIYTARRRQDTPSSRLMHAGKHVCRVSSDRKDVARADGVFVDVFYLREFKPPKRPHPDQVWMFYNKESEYNIRNVVHWQTKAWRGFFNWTISYRRDSDIPYSYGELIKGPKPNKNWLKMTKSKKRMAAWIVGNCRAKSRRMEYVKKLQKYGVQVDIYGRCGTLKLSREKDAEKQCFDDHKFYISFESAFCEDYVTEKFLKILNFDTIPVVRGGANYSKLFPVETFINTADFKSAKHLAKYLLYLDKNDAAYAKLLERKSAYRSKLKPPWNQICKRLHELPSYRKVYPDIEEWMKCRNPSGIGSAE